MRPLGRDELDSLYFDYPRYCAPKLSKEKKERSVDVVIVGAGPIGLTAALTLERYGISSVIIELKVPLTTEAAQSVLQDKVFIFLILLML